MFDENNKVYITGYGLVSALGIGKTQNSKKLFDGDCGLSKSAMEYADKTVVSSFGVILDDLPIDKFFAYNDIVPDRVMKLAVLAVDEAIAQSKLQTFSFNPLRIGVVVGTSLGGMLSGDKFHSIWLTKGISKTDASILKQYPLHAVADVIAKKYGFNGTKIIISTACSSGANALGLAYDLISDGQCDIVIAGGVDPLSRFSFAGFTALGAINADVCQPYSNSVGINIGEASAFFVMESGVFAENRNAQKVCEFCGYGLSADAYHPTAPDINGLGAVRSMNIAMENSGISVNQISYINGHGTGTPANDNAERKVWKNFTTSNNKIPMISNKGSVGHCMGAAGAIEIAFSILSFERGLIPPTINFTTAPSEEINLVPNIALNADVSTVLSNSFAFGGNNCSVIISNDNNRCNNHCIEQDDVVVTGIGCVGIGGNTVSEFFDTLSKGNSVISEVSVVGKDYKTPFVGQANTDDIFFKKYIQAGKLRRIDKITKFTMTSGRQALLDSKLMVTPNNSARIGVIYGTGTGPSVTIKTISEQIIKSGISAIEADMFPNSVLNAAPGQFSIANNLKGVTSTISSGNTSGLNAVIYATMLLKSNQADAIIVISSDEWDETLHVGNERLGLLTSKGNLPFSGRADGVILSEGSVAFVLERKSYALQRKAKLYAEINGYFSVSNNPCLSDFDYIGTQWLDGFSTALNSSNKKEIDLYVSTSLGNIQLDNQEFQLYNALFPNANFYSVPRIIGTPFGSVGSYALLSCIYALISKKRPAILDITDVDDMYKSIFLSPEREIKCAATSVASYGGAYAGLIVSAIL